MLRSRETTNFLFPDIQKQPSFKAPMRQTEIQVILQSRHIIIHNEFNFKQPAKRRKSMWRNCRISFI